MSHEPETHMTAAERQLATALRALHDTPELAAAEARVWKRLQHGSGRSPRSLWLRLAPVGAVLAVAALTLLLVWRFRQETPETLATDDDLMALGLYDTVLNGTGTEEELLALYGDEAVEELPSPPERIADPHSLDDLYEDYDSALGQGGVYLTSH